LSMDRVEELNEIAQRIAMARFLAWCAETGIDGEYTAASCKPMECFERRILAITARRIAATKDELIEAFRLAEDWLTSAKLKILEMN
jgi:hypothetical protein